jgi:hypothetical protein
MNSQGNIEQKEQCCEYHNTRLQTVLQSDSNKNSMVLAQSRYKEQWSRMEDLDMKPHSYAHLIFDKDAKNIR